MAVRSGINIHDSHKMKPAKDGGTLPGDLMTQEILQTRDQKQKIEGQSKIKQDRVGPAMPNWCRFKKFKTACDVTRYMIM
jgi:hypothetical protein